MSLGLSERFNILSQSPHDLSPLSEVDSGREEIVPKKEALMPSRFTLRARAADGRLVLWNSYAGTISVFRADQAAAVEAMLVPKGVIVEVRGIAEYLLNRGFLIKKGADEYSRFQLAFGSRQYRSDVLDLILMASEDCNFRCIYCYEKFSHGTMRPEVREGIKKHVESRLPRLRVLSIGWFGGEPLYGFDAIEDLAPFFQQLAREHSLRFHSNMTTNGYLLTPEVAQKLLSWDIRRFQITLDGPAQCHNHSRPTRNGEGSFDVIYSNLKALRQRPDEFLVHLRMNFSPETRPHMESFLDLAEKEFRGDERFRLRFRAVGKWGGRCDDQLEVYEADEGNRLVLDFERMAQERGLAIADGLKASTSLGTQVCYAARPNHYVIGATGKVMKCTVALDDDRNNVGQLTPEGRLEMDLNKLSSWVAPYFEGDSQCQRCVVLPVCQGISCPLARISGSRPCIPARAMWKKELLSSLTRTTPTCVRRV